MDVDESLLCDWEDETFFKSLDEDLDFSIALSSQTESEGDFKENTNITENKTFFKSVDEDLDFSIALSLQEEFEDDFKKNTNITEKSGSNDPKLLNPISIVDHQWELIDPHPDIHALFLQYDKKFFYGKLLGVEVRWSPRMTLCAGVCSYEGRGGLCSIGLSVPLLKLRPRRDLVETLLHEMIHAYLFVTHNNRDHGSHGPEFLSHMNRINKETGTRITVYHSFHDEVDLYKQHWWQCDGPCRSRHPFYGLVKRAMNRAPGPNDNWWADHQAKCNGTYIKIKEPENYKKKAPKRKADSGIKDSGSQTKLIFKEQTPKPVLKGNNFSVPLTKSSNIATVTSVLAKENRTVSVNSKEICLTKHFVPFKGNGQKLGGTVKNSPVCPYMSNNSSQSSSSNSQKKLPSSFVNANSSILSSKSPKVQRVESSSSSKHTDSIPSCSKAPNTPLKKLIQSPIESFLSPKKSHLEEQLHKRPSFDNVPNTRTNNNIEILTVTVKCPVCFKPVEISDINSHLDKCIQ